MQSLPNNKVSRIRHHHQRKSASDESLADEDLDQDKICINSQYKWKKKILSEHFGGIMRNNGRIVKLRCPEGILSIIDFLYCNSLLKRYRRYKSQ